MSVYYSCARCKKQLTVKVQSKPCKCDWLVAAILVFKKMPKVQNQSYLEHCVNKNVF